MAERKAILACSNCLGVQFSFIGFPAASYRESSDCEELARYIHEKKLAVTPVLMCRAVETDLDEVIRCRDQSGADILADIFVSTSPIRMRVEGWCLADMLRRLKKIAEIAARNCMRYRLAFEDSSRTPPGDLEDAIRLAVDVGAECVVVNDTVGDCYPFGATRLIEFVRNCLDRYSNNMAICWHGHNDRGLGLANALAAADSGAQIISGTFLGIGERSGNIPLEQLILCLIEAGSVLYQAHELVPMCRLYSEGLGFPVPQNNPLVGRDAFSTATGTHASAIIKAQNHGAAFVDHVFSSVSARLLGREQVLLVGPNSGKTVVQHILQQNGVTATDEVVFEVMEYLEASDRCMEGGELLHSIRHSPAAASNFITDPRGICVEEDNRWKRLANNTKGMVVPTQTVSCHSLRCQSGALASDEEFDANSYSKMKYGSIGAARMWGYSLGRKMLDSVSNVVLGECPLEAIVVYKAVPPAALALTRFCLDVINRQRVAGGYEPGTVIHVEADRTFPLAYSKLSIEERRSALSQVSYSTDGHDFDGKTVVVIDDIRVTGSAEQEMRDFLERFRPKNLVFAYVVSISPEDGASHPQIEDWINTRAINDLMDIFEIVASHDFALNIRTLQRILADPDATAREEFLCRVHDHVLCEIFSGIVSSGPTFAQHYQEGLNAVQQEMVARHLL